MSARGFTLIEVLVTLAIIVVLARVGIPSFRAFSGDAEVSGVTATYLHAFNSGRYAAVTAQRPVSICDLDAQGTCVGTWGGRLTVFFDDDNDGRLARGEDVIDVAEVRLAHPVSITFRAFGKTRYLHLGRNGHYRQNGTFSFCAAAGRPGRSIVINGFGRARTETTSCR